MLRLSDQELSEVMGAASQVPPASRAAYLEALAAELEGLPMTGPGAVRRAARALVPKFAPGQGKLAAF